MDQFWQLLFDIVLLLAAAALLGGLFERIGQSALLGYLLAGTLLGPGVLHVVHGEQSVQAMAELGVALLLFSIGLEVSWARLRSLGSGLLLAGALQIILTAAAATGVCLALGLSVKASLALGAVVAPSSTACVLRLLNERAEIESVHGRVALGILLLQDMALVPLVLFVSALSGGGSAGEVFLEVGKTLLVAALLLVALMAVGRHLLPLLMSTAMVRRNREIPILLAFTVCLGATWLSHTLHLSPAFGAFIAGMFLAETPFAAQIRAEVGPLRTLFVTLFFASIGMLSRPAWMLAWLPQILLVVVLILVGKTLITWLATWFSGRSQAHSMAAGLCVSQAGEFSFVLASTALAGAVISPDVFNLVVSATIVTLFLTPPLISLAAPIGHRWELALMRLGWAPPPVIARSEEEHRPSDHVILVGFGPAGQTARLAFEEAHVPTVIVELNPRNVLRARNLGYEAEVGDATRREVIEHLGVKSARAVVVTIPDQRAVSTIIAQMHAVAPLVPVFVRARHHVHALHYHAAGAEGVVDEETEVGRLLGREVLEHLHPGTVDGTTSS